MKPTRLLKIATLLLFTHLICSCIAMDHLAKVGEKPYLNDKLRYFLISSDETSIVLIGDKYHYILNSEKSLSTFLKSSHSNKSGFLLRNLEVSDGKISGSYQMYIHNKNITPADEIDLMKLGLKKTDHGYYLGGNINGNMFLSRPIDEKALNKLPQEDEIVIHQRPSKASRVVQIAASPLAVAADLGVVIIASSAVVFTVVPVCLVTDLSNLVVGTKKICQNGFGIILTSQ